MLKINEDLQRERDRCTFCIQELTTIIDGGEEETANRKKREALFLSEEGVFDDVPEEYLGQKEKYHGAVKRSCYIFKSVRKMQQESNTDISDYRSVLAGILGSSLVRDGAPLGLHYIMFMPAIINLGDEEQHATWLPRAWNCSIIGSFAQTELGHGTFIRGLETTATYDPASQQFVLNTPTLTAYKWWPGGLGHTANYCIVAAQLYIQGECFGVHFFIIQLRDEETHMPLPGIHVGDVGAKLGLNAVNNGFLALKNVRVPRRNMLMKHAKVLEDGTYVKSSNSKLNYSAMVFVRVVIVYDMMNFLSKAVTIAVRYSAVRRQCQLQENEPEVQILDYLTQQHKLLIAISTWHALRAAADRLWDTFREFQLGGGNMDLLPELHALACCLKASSTSETSRLVECCRLACGGHGYMTSSNLPMMYGTTTAACTYEGENTVLLLQTARYLIKTWQQIDTAKMTPTVEYLKRTSQPSYPTKWVQSVDGIIAAFEIVAMRKISSSAESMQREVAAGASMGDAWNRTSVRLVAAAQAHCQAVILRSFSERTSKTVATASKDLGRVLVQLLKLYAAYWAIERLSDLLLYTQISESDVRGLHAWYEQLLIDLRPNAVGLVDAFDIRDDLLQSTLGAYDGRVYERLMSEALKSPLNQEPVDESFHKYLKPFMRGKL